MQRLIEQPVAEGEVVQNGTAVGRVHYHLAVYQHFSEQEGEAVPSHSKSKDASRRSTSWTSRRSTATDVI